MNCAFHVLQANIFSSQIAFKGVECQPKTQIHPVGKKYFVTRAEIIGKAILIIELGLTNATHNIDGRIQGDRACEKNLSRKEAAASLPGS